MSQDEITKNPRVVVVQKLYSYSINQDSEIKYPKHRFKKFIKDVVKGTIERKDLITKLIDTELKFRTLDEFKGSKVVISFFVAASSPVCEVELCTFRDKWNEISELGAQVIAISNDGPFANKAFAEKNNYNFPVLGDYQSKTIRDYDVLLPDLLHVKDYNAAKRSVFILNEEHKIIWKWVVDDPLKEPNYDEIIQVLKSN